MKTLPSFPRAALLALALGTAGITATFAQTSPTTTPDSSPPAKTCHHHGAVLSSDEKAQLKKAYEAAIAADPTLKSDGDSLKQQHEALKAKGDAATADEKTALREQWHAFHHKLRTAEMKADPSLGPVFAKLKAAHKDHQHTDSSST
jgi:hypothetical protein